MPNNEKPTNPVPDSYLPPGGTAYPVKTGESWISIARAHGIPPWDLIEFNFPGSKRQQSLNGERAARQVNWYLFAYVGCRTPSPDGQNWSFTSGLTRGKGSWKGGIIFIPPQNPSPIPPPPPTPTPTLPVCEMAQPDFYRLLNLNEQALATKVFGNTLPPWNEIGIGNGLGMGGDPWTSDGIFIRGVDYPPTPDVRYAMNLGSVASVDMTSSAPTSGLLCGDYGTIAALFVHEMTHVWQYRNDSGVMRSAIWARTLGAGYDYRIGGSWNSYNKEQQASIVEHWFANGASKTDDRYPYIRLVVRSGRLEYPRTLTLNELKRDLADLRRRNLD